MAVAREISDTAFVAQSCYSLGNTFTLMRKYHKAIEFHSVHLQYAQQLEDRCVHIQYMHSCVCIYMYVTHYLCEN